jgi:hypothetical protein
MLKKKDDRLPLKDEDPMPKAINIKDSISLGMYF